MWQPARKAVPLEGTPDDPASATSASLMSFVGNDLAADRLRSHAEAAFRWMPAGRGSVQAAMSARFRGTTWSLRSSCPRGGGGRPVVAYGAGGRRRGRSSPLSCRRPQHQPGILLLCAPLAWRPAPASATKPACSPAAQGAAPRCRRCACDLSRDRWRTGDWEAGRAGRVGHADGPASAMALAADRDLIARQYAHGFGDLVTVGCTLPARDRSWPCAVSVQRTFLRLSAFPDSHIARKFGRETRQVQDEAKPWLAAIEHDGMARHRRASRLGMRRSSSAGSIRHQRGSHGSDAVYGALVRPALTVAGSGPHEAPILARAAPWSRSCAAWILLTYLVAEEIGIVRGLPGCLPAALSRQSREMIRR